MKLRIDLLDYFDQTTIFMCLQTNCTLKRLNKAKDLGKVDLGYINWLQKLSSAIATLSPSYPMSYPHETSIEYPILGQKGISATYDIPPVPPEAPSASSNLWTRKNSSPEPVFEVMLDLSLFPVHLFNAYSIGFAPNEKSCTAL